MIVSLLDLKLGARMLAKYPGVAIVGGLGMALSIAIGTGSHAVLSSFLNPSLPFDESDRIVGLQVWDAAANDHDDHIVHDVALWQRSLRSVVNVGAFRSVGRNIIGSEGQPEPVLVAEMSAAGFAVTRVPPLMGRTLVEDDERPSAPDVVVIGHDVWRNRFGADSGVIGRVVRLGGTSRTIVGVMPEDYRFPLYHGIWVPLRLDATASEPRKGIEITAFGRLAPGVTLDEARAELETYAHRLLRPRAVPYPALFFADDDRWEFQLMQAMLTLMLVLVCANVAVLVYARTATRLGEIAVRTALGASRRRIVAQLFGEALVLSGLAAVLGLGVAQFALGQLGTFLNQRGAGSPFWMNFALTGRSLIYAAGLAVLGAAIVGIVPALKATGRKLESALRQLGGGTRMELGRTWSGLIVLQVAIAVAILPVTVNVGWEMAARAVSEPAFAASEYLTSSLVLDPERPADSSDAAVMQLHQERFAVRRTELARRLAQEPGVTHVAFALERPGDESRAFVDVEGVSRPADGFAVGTTRVSREYFDAFDVGLVSGRMFAAADQDTSSTAVIVNESFARLVLGSSPLGRRLRYEGDSDTTARWFEIVGVVRDLESVAGEDDLPAQVYHALPPGSTLPSRIVVRLRGASARAFLPRMRAVAKDLDPALQLRALLPLDEDYRSGRNALRMGALGVGVVTLSVLLLSAAGIYAMMSFTVARRRREIGIRSALGADPRRILGTIFRHALLQIVGGVILGVAGGIGIDYAAGGDSVEGLGLVLLPMVAGLMLIVGLIAATGPARRALRIPATEALNAE